MVKNPPANAGDTDSIPGLGRSPGEGNGHSMGDLPEPGIKPVSPAMEGGFFTTGPLGTLP